MRAWQCSPQVAMQTLRPTVIAADESKYLGDGAYSIMECFCVIIVQKCMVAWLQRLGQAQEA